MNKLLKLAVFLISIILTNTSYAQLEVDPNEVAFVNDVVFVSSSEERIKSYTPTGTLELTLSEEDVNQFGRELTLLHDRNGVWPCDRNGVIGLAIGFVEIDGIWYGGSWEFMGCNRFGRSEGAFVGPGHLRFPPLQNFRPRDGEIYGFMVTPNVRNNAPNSLFERTEIAFYEWGVGPVPNEQVFGTAQSTSLPVTTPAIDFLLSDPPAPVPE